MEFWSLKVPDFNKGFFKSDCCLLPIIFVEYECATDCDSRCYPAHGSPEGTGYQSSSTHQLTQHDCYVPTVPVYL